MTEVGPKNLVINILRDCELDWWITAAGGEDRIFDHLSKLITEFAKRMMFRTNTSVLPESIFSLYHQKPHQIKAFLQAASVTSKLDMLVMSWQILQGMKIEEVELNYHIGTSFFFRVVLQTPNGEEAYESTDINDATLIRHFGTMQLDGKPIFHGFFPVTTKVSSGTNKKTHGSPLEFKTLKNTLEVCMLNLFNRYLDVRRLEQIDSMKLLSEIPGDHTITFPILGQHTSSPEVNSPLSQATIFMDLWNQELEKKTLHLFQKEKIICFVGTCIAKALQQIDIMEGKSPPREPFFGGRYYHEVMGMPWDSY